MRDTFFLNRGAGYGDKPAPFFVKLPVKSVEFTLFFKAFKTVLTKRLVENNINGIG